MQLLDLSSLLQREWSEVERMSGLQRLIVGDEISTGNWLFWLCDYSHRADVDWAFTQAVNQKETFLRMVLVK